MDAPAQQFAAYFIELDCQVQDCRGPRTYQVRGLATIYQAETMRDLVARLKCSECGRPPAKAILWSDNPWSGSPRLRRLALLGAAV